MAAHEFAQFRFFIQNQRAAAPPGVPRLTAVHNRMQPARDAGGKPGPSPPRHTTSYHLVTEHLTLPPRIQHLALLTDHTDPKSAEGVGFGRFPASYASINPDGVIVLG
jgi:hypothetical protein